MHETRCREGTLSGWRHTKAVALPEYSSTVVYQQWVIKKQEEGIQIRPVAILNRATFLRMFTEEELERTIVRLSTHGKPIPLTVDVRHQQS